MRSSAVTVLPSAMREGQTVSRWQVTKAVRASSLPAPSKLIMLTLADVAEVGTAEIPERHTPSLTVLAAETGLDRSTVRRHLDLLETAGWVVRMRPTIAAARAQKERTRYRLTTPASESLGAEDPQRLGADIPQPGGTEPPELGAENTTARGTQPLNNRSTDQVRSSSKRRGKRGEPGEPSPLECQTNDLAAAWWERYGSRQAQTFVAVRQVIRAALRNGVDRNKLAFALDDLGKEGRPVSGGAITVALNQRANGRASPNGHRAYQNPTDPNAYEEGL